MSLRFVTKKLKNQTLKENKEEKGDDTLERSDMVCDDDDEEDEDEDDSKNQEEDVIGEENANHNRKSGIASSFCQTLSSLATPVPSLVHLQECGPSSSEFTVDDNYSSEEELIEIISSEKKRKRIGEKDVMTSPVLQQHIGADNKFYSGAFINGVPSIRSNSTSSWSSRSPSRTALQTLSSGVVGGDLNLSRLSNGMIRKHGMIRYRSGSLSAPAMARILVRGGVSNDSASCCDSSDSCCCDDALGPQFRCTRSTSQSSSTHDHLNTPVQFCTSPPSDAYKPTRHQASVTSSSLSSSPPTKLCHLETTSGNFNLSAVNNNTTTTNTTTFISLQQFDSCLFTPAPSSHSNDSVLGQQKLTTSAKMKEGWENIVGRGPRCSCRLYPAAIHRHVGEGGGRHHSQRRRCHSHNRNPIRHSHIMEPCCRAPSPTKRHRITPTPQRPCLDFEKMQQIKKHVVTSWRPRGTELSLFC